MWWVALVVVVVVSVVVVAMFVVLVMVLVVVSSVRSLLMCRVVVHIPARVSLPLLDASTPPPVAEKVRFLLPTRPLPRPSRPTVHRRRPRPLCKVLEVEDVAPGAVQATPRPPMPKANQLEAKKARLVRWEKDPSLIEKDMDRQREALNRAQKEDLQVNA